MALIRTITAAGNGTHRFVTTGRGDTIFISGTFDSSDVTVNLAPSHASTDYAVQVTGITATDIVKTEPRTPNNLSIAVVIANGLGSESLLLEHHSGKV